MAAKDDTTLAKRGNNARDAEAHCHEHQGKNHAGTPYTSDEPGSEVAPLPVKVVCALHITRDPRRTGIKRGMRVLELGCGVGDVTLRIAKLVGPSGLVVGVDESAELIDVAQKRATVTGQCYWTRFVTADLNTFMPNERYDAVVVHRTPPLECERALFLRLSNWVHPDGVIMVRTGKLAAATDDRSSKWWRGL
jgi:2-polyprenyl-3-methyl-5-hydroxy-6-metoxy-1,4-benzoquinol methylase